ncbi:MAG: class I SAM-dependent methyltransferase [Candidatus Aenigmarchaeota archaeon]|nr:class I SAM-dependent methyltransferase [Candidatus Aenigmarchaeota archaeon]
MDTRKLERQIEEEWEETYRVADVASLPREAFEPPSRLVELVKKGLVKKGKALDVGCGLGATCVFLALNGFYATGVDISKTALKYAEEIAKENNVKIRLIRGFAHKLDFPPKTFSLVVDRGCLHHTPKELWEGYIENVHRVLGNGGSFYLECFSDKSAHAGGHKFSREGLEKLFGDRFSIERVAVTRNRDVEGRELYINCVLMREK